MRLSDSIETFIKTLLAEDEPEVELKRNELYAGERKRPMHKIT